MSTIDTKNNMSPSISNNSTLNKKHKLDKENFTIKIASASSVSLKTDSECENDKIYKRKKRFRSENHSNINDYNNKHQDYSNKNGFHRIKRQALTVDRDRSMNNARPNQFSERSKLPYNNEKCNRSINILGSSDQTNSSSSLKIKNGYRINSNYENGSQENIKINISSDSSENNNRVCNENINTSNKTTGNGSYNNFSKKKFNYNNGSEKSRFWSARNSSNPMHRNYNNRIRQGVTDSSLNKLMNNDDNSNADNNDGNNNNSIDDNDNNNDITSINNSTGGGMSRNPDKKKHPFLNKHDNIISKNKKKPISAMAAAAAVNQTNLPANTKISIINSLNKEIKSKKLRNNISHDQSTTSSTSSSSVHSKNNNAINTKAESTTDINNSNTNNTSIVIPMDPTASIRSLVTSKEAGVIIGREGKYITKIREDSCAKVTVSEHVPGSLDRIITVTGEIDTVVKAFFMMTKLIVVEFEKEKNGLVKISGSSVLNSVNKEDSVVKSSSNNITDNDITDNDQNQNDELLNESIEGVDSTISDNNINDTNIPYEDDIQEDSYQYDSLQENKNDDLQMDSENLNHDDITKVLNIMNTSNNNSDTEENMMMKDDLNEDLDNTSTNDNSQDMELDGQKKNDQEENDDYDLKELFENRTLTLRILIPDNRMGSIIGKGGSKIKEIQEKSHSTIVAAEEILPNSTEKVLKISGTVDAIKLAIYDVGNILRENPDRNLHTIYYKPMPLNFYKNTVPPSYPLVYPPQVIPPNFAKPVPPYACPLFINTAAPPPPAPPVPPTLTMAIGPYQPPAPPPPMSHPSLPQFNPKPQFTKNFHKSTNNSKMNNTNANNKNANNNSNNTNNKSFNGNNNNTNNKKNAKFNNKPGTFIFKGNSNNRTSSLSTSTSTIPNNNQNNKSAFSKSISNDNHSYSKSSNHYQGHNTFHHSKSKDRSKVSSHSGSYTSSPLVPQGPLDLSSNIPVVFQNVDVNLGPKVPAYSVNTFNMEIGIPNMINSPQPILPSPRLNDLRMMSPPLTPPPPSMTSSFHSNSNNVVSNNQSYSHRRNGTKGNPDIPLIQGFNGIPTGMSPLNPIYDNINQGYTIVNPNKPNSNQSAMNSSSFVSSLFPTLNPMKSKLNQNKKSSSPRTPLSSVQVKHLYIAKEFVGCIIGKQGDIIKQIRNISGSQIVIDVAHPNSTDRLITITGNNESNKIAENMILGRVENEKNKMMNQQLSPSQSPV